MSLRVFDDERGRVLPVEHLSPQLPFVPVRTFVICNVPAGKSRAEHTLTCDQVLVAATGSVNVIVKVDGGETRHVLDTPGAALHIPEGAWIALNQFSRDAVLIVLAAKPYQPRN
jgi:UDP-2-acetamido-3-amino-2,3-dideoxy-glucuronate N-acetyltransferase